jgi:imidazolonepropionase-like amidohydrolase
VSSLRPRLLAFVLLLLPHTLAAQAATPPDTGQVTAIRAGRLLDTETGTAAANQVILVRAGKIVAVGSDVAVPSGARTIDLSDKTVLPGLFDAHTHMLLTEKQDRDNYNYYYTTLT